MKKVCNFCGREEKEVRLLITGLHGFICDECATQAYNIVQSAGLDDTGNAHSGKIAFKLKDVPKPKEIKKYLDDYGLGRMRPSVISPYPCTTTINVCSSLPTTKA